MQLYTVLLSKSSQADDGEQDNMDGSCVVAQNNIMQLFHKEYKSAKLVFLSNKEVQLVNLPAEVTNPIDTKEFQFKLKIIVKGRHVQYNTVIRCVMSCLFQCTQAPKKLKPKAFDVDPDQFKSDDDDDELDGGDNDECLGMTGVESPSKKCQSEGDLSVRSSYLDSVFTCIRGLIYGTNLISYNLFCDIIFSLMRIICYR